MTNIIRNKQAKKRNIVSLFLTLTIILALVVAGPVQAVKVNLKTDRGVYSRENTVVTFESAVDIQRNERVPITLLRLKILDQVGNEFKICEFMPDGSNACPNLDITLLNPGDETVGDRNGEGFGFVNEGDEPDTAETDFGFGYGFEDETGNSGFNGELKYEIMWDLEADDVPNGKYQAVLEAFAEDTESQYTYISKRPKTFHVKLNPADEVSEEEKAVIGSRDGEIISINSITGFDKDKADFSAALRRTIVGEDDVIEGTTSLNLYGEKEDGTKVNLEIRMKDKQFEFVEFTKEKIELNGKATFDYHKTKKGTSPVKSMGTIEDISLVIDDGKIMMSSTDPDMPFEAELIINSFSFK